MYYLKQRDNSFKKINYVITITDWQNLFLQQLGTKVTKSWLT